MIEQLVRVINPYWKRIYTYRKNADGSRQLVGMQLIPLQSIPYGMV